LIPSCSDHHPINFVEFTAKNEEEAVEYIERNHQKWYPPMGVPFLLTKDEIGYVVGGWCSY
jgi:hypothetical protein